MAAARKKAQKAKDGKPASKATKSKDPQTSKDPPAALEKVERLLFHLGFVDITTSRDVPEIGVDLRFAEYDRFGYRRVHAAHLRDEAVSGKKKEIAWLVDHARAVFEASIEGESQVEGLYLITAKEFEKEALEQIASDESLAPYRRGLFFLGGAQIDAHLSRGYREQKELARLAKQELEKNSSIAQFNMDSWSGGKASLFRYQARRTQALADQVALHDDDGLCNKLEKYLFLIDSFNQAAHIVLFSEAPGLTTHYVKRLEEGASAVYKQSEELLREVEHLIEASPH